MDVDSESGSAIFPILSRLKQSDQEEKALLAACQAVLDETGIRPVLASYYGILFQTIEGSIAEIKKFQDEAKPVTPTPKFTKKPVGNPNSQQKERCRAALRLMNKVAIRLPEATQLKLFKETAKLIIQLFQKEPPQTVTTHALALIRTLINASTQIDFTELLYSQILKLVVQQIAEGRPKARHKALDVAESIFSVPGRSLDKAQVVEQYCIKVIKECRQDNVHSTLHIMHFLKKCIGRFPTNMQKKLCEVILALPSFGQSMLTTYTFNVIASLFDSLDSAAVLATQLLNALFDIQPRSIEVEPLQAFTKALESGCLHLLTYNPTFAQKKLTTIIQRLVIVFQCARPEVRKIASLALQEILERAINQEMVDDTINSVDTVDDEEDSPHLLLEIINEIKASLKYIYQNAWNDVLPVVKTLFNCIQKRVPKDSSSLPQFRNSASILVREIIVDVSGLYQQTEWKIEAAEALKSGLYLIGVSKFLEWPSIDYEATTTPEDTNHWVLSFLKKSLDSSELSFFARYFLPPSDALIKTSKSLASKGRPVESRLLQNLNTQIWETFPRFCSNPTDLTTSFAELQQLLVTILVNNSQGLRILVSSALHSLISKNKDLLREGLQSFDKNPVQAKIANDNIQAIKPFARNFLPQLFQTLLLPLEHSHQVALSQVAAAFISISDAKLINAMFENVLKKLIVALSTPLSENPEEKTQQLGYQAQVTHLVTMFLPEIDGKQTQLVFQAISPNLKSEDAILQKKSWKICNLHRDLLRANITETIELLQIRTAAQIKKSRIRLMKFVFQESEQLSLELFRALLPEIILYTKEVSGKTREEALEVLYFLGDKCLRDGGSSALKNLFDVISAGLALDQHFASTSLRSLTYLYTRFATNLTPEYQVALIDTALLLLKLNSREIVASTFEFMRSFIIISPIEVLIPKIPELTTSVCQYSSNPQNRFRLKVRALLEKMIRRAGFEAVEPHAPPELAKHLRIAQAKHNDHLKKKTRQEKKAKTDTEMGEDDEESVDEDDLFDIPIPKQGQGTWIVDHKSDDQILDFLSSGASKHVVSTDPSRKPKRTREEGFEKDENGRFIFEEPKEEERPPKRKKSDNRLVTDEMLGAGFTKKPVKKISVPKATPGTETGLRYKDSKVGGDVKKGNSKFEPFAYVPLDPAQLNKRSKQSAHKRYDGIVSHKKTTRGVTKPLRGGRGKKRLPKNKTPLAVARAQAKARK